MHVITQQRIWAAKKKFPESANALDAWYRIISKNTFLHFADLKACFNSVDKTDKFFIFDIGGNKLRLIACIHFNRQKVYIRDILSHTEYERKNWKH